MALEDELLHLVSASSDKRKCQIFCRKTGLDGQGGATLQVTADEFGLTRERVRQICDKIARNLKYSQKPMPYLDKAVGLISSRQPVLADKIELRLVSVGIASAIFRIEGILEATNIIGHKAAFLIEEFNGRRVILSPKAIGLPKTIIRAAKKTITRWGVASIADIHAQIESTDRQKAHVGQFISDILSLREDFQWLDKDSGWFWLRTVPRNRLLNQIAKILSVARKISISELRSGVSRHHRMRGVSPPRRVLLELCRQLPNYHVSDDVIIAKPSHPKWEDVLETTEQVMVLLLQENGSVLSRDVFEEKCLSLGMKRSTFYAYLSYSPVIVKLYPSVYGLRGAKIEAGVINTLRPKRHVSKVLQDYGWTSDKKVWIGYKISKAIINTGILGIPAAMKRFVEGEFQLITEDDTIIGTLVAKGSNAWGLSPFFSRRGGEPGDYLVLTFDLSSRQSRVQLGDETLIEDYQP